LAPHPLNLQAPHADTEEIKKEIFMAIQNRFRGFAMSLFQTRSILMNGVVQAAVLSCVATAVHAQSAEVHAYPTKPVRIVVGYAPGGSTDLLARLVAQKLTIQFGKQFIVENRPGANGNIGAEAVSRTAPDGYTILMGTISQTINQSLYPKMAFDIRKDFAPVSMVAQVPNVLVVHPSVPAKNAREFVSLAKAKPGEINFASAGAGSSLHMSGELFKLTTGANIVHIPYKGSGPAVADLLGGQVQSMFDNLPSAVQYIKSGRVRALAVTSAERSPTLPDVPTMAEAGVPGVQVSGWFALFAPANTPKEIVDRLNSELNKVLKTVDMKERMADVGAEPAGGTPQQLGAYVVSETEKWAKVVKASGAQAN
jgi:tripartite-type tricarboxylate transporter receptor subunit TctC